MKIGFTGTQKGMTDPQWGMFLVHVSDILNVADFIEFHHGDCIGADYEAFEILKRFHTVAHPGCDKNGKSPKAALTMSDNIRRTKPYLERNHDIVDETELLIAAPKEMQEELRSGTWATIRYAYKVGKSVIIIFPDGTRQTDKFTWLPGERLVPIEPRVKLQIEK